MTIQITAEQYAAIESTATRRQLKRIMLGYADDIHASDPDLAERIRSDAGESHLALFQKIYNLTSDRYYQRALLAILVDTGIDVFDNEEFDYILNHPILSGDAKARHLVLSSHAACPRR